MNVIFRRTIVAAIVLMIGLAVGYLIGRETMRAHCLVGVEQCRAAQ